ncbi:hypothetical protein MalM25_01620 [Planctomycetes bacterium MalM25]|nr:hypothetical protein MalM25_01620 [Planctomycetes bacterium MalM25]
MPTEPVSIAQTVVFGVAFDPKNSERVARMDLNELFASVGRLFDLLEEREIDYVLVGGIAMLLYVEGRNTQDIDLIVSEEDLKMLPELRIDERNERFVQARLGDLRVDLLLAEKEPFRLVLEQHTAAKPFADRTIPTASEEGLLLLKLFALPSLYRQGQFSKVNIYEGDIAQLITSVGTVGPDTWDALEDSLVESDVAELRKIVAGIEDKIANEGNRFGGEG